MTTLVLADLIRDEACQPDEGAPVNLLPAVQAYWRDCSPHNLSLILPAMIAVAEEPEDEE